VDLVRLPTQGGELCLDMFRGHNSSGMEVLQSGLYLGAEPLVVRCSLGLPGHILAHEPAQELGRGPILLACERRELLLQRFVDPKCEGGFGHAGLSCCDRGAS